MSRWRKIRDYKPFFASSLSLVFFMIVGLPSFLYVLWTQSKNLDEAKQTLSREANEQTNKIKYSLEEQLVTLQKRLKTLALDSDLRMGDRSILFYGRVAQRLEETRIDSPLMAKLSFVGSADRLIAESPSSAIPQANLLSILQPWREAKQPLIISISTEETSRRFLMILAIQDIFGGSAGTLLAEINEPYLREQALKAAPLSTLTTSLSLADPRTALVTDPLVTATPFTVQSIDWLLLQDSSKTLQTIRSRQTKTLSVSLGLILLGLVLTYSLSQLFIRPLQKLKKLSEILANQALNDRDKDLFLQTITFREFQQFARMQIEMAQIVEEQHLQQQKTLAREAALQQAHLSSRLANLKNQINPHFLFNALNSIQSLIDVRPEEASLMVQELSDLYRHILQASQKILTPLADECQLTTRYLRFQKRRFGKRLEFHIDERFPTVWVPSLLIQNLVENAIKHGLEPYREGAMIQVSFEQDRGGYLCTVSNQLANQASAADYQITPIKGTHTGLAMAKHLLALLYGDKAEFQLMIDTDGRSARAKFWFSGALDEPS